MSIIATSQYTITDLSDSFATVVIGTQASATNAWTGTTTLNELKDGQTIMYWLPYNGNTTAATLNLTLGNGTSTGAKNVYINGTTRCTNQITAGNMITMTYRVNAQINGSAYTGWWIMRNQDTITDNYYDRIQYKAAVSSAEVISAGTIGVFNANGKLIKLSATPFDTTKPILYIGTAYSSANASNTNNYISWGTPFAITNTVSGFSGTAGATVYIKGTLDKTLFTPASGIITTTLPAREDGYAYMLLGLMSTSTNMVLPPEHPIFQYYNGGFKTISQIAYEAYEAIDNLSIGGRNYIQNSRDMILEGVHGLIDGSWFYNSENIEVYDGRTDSALILTENGTSRPTYRLKTLPLKESGPYIYTVWIMPTQDIDLAVNMLGVSRWYYLPEKEWTKITIVSENPVITDENGVTGYIDFSPIFPTSASTDKPKDIYFYKSMLERGNKATDWSPAPEDTETDVNDLISRMTYAEEVIEKDSIVNMVLSSTEYQEYVETTTTTLTQLDEAMTMNFQNLTERADNSDQQFESYVEKQETWIRFDDDGIHMGKNNENVDEGENQFTMDLSNQELAFLEDGVKVAYINNQTLNITEAEVETQLKIGKFAFVPTQTGMALIYVG